MIIVIIRKFLLNIDSCGFVDFQAQLTSSGGALSAAKEEVKKLTLQLQTQQQRGEESTEKLRQQHRQAVQRLESRVSPLYTL